MAWDMMLYRCQLWLLLLLLSLLSRERLLLQCSIIVQGRALAFVQRQEILCAHSTPLHWKCPACTTRPRLVRERS